MQKKGLPLDSIKEKPNESERNGSDPNSVQNENSGSKSNEEHKEHNLDLEEEGAPVVVEEFKENEIFYSNQHISPFYQYKAYMT